MKRKSHYEHYNAKFKLKTIESEKCAICLKRLIHKLNGFSSTIIDQSTNLKLGWYIFIMM